MNNYIEINRQKNYELWKTVFMTIAIGLIGTVTNSMRGIALDFDGEVVKITVIFEKTPTEEEIENLQNIEAEVISTHNHISDLELLEIPVSKSIFQIERNLGWVFLRKE